MLGHVHGGRPTTSGSLRDRLARLVPGPTTAWDTALVVPARAGGRDVPQLAPVLDRVLTRLGTPADEVDARLADRRMSDVVADQASALVRDKAAREALHAVGEREDRDLQMVWDVLSHFGPRVLAVRGLVVEQLFTSGNAERYLTRLVLDGALEPVPAG